jgi:hypothetical protein
MIRKLIPVLLALFGLGAGLGAGLLLRPAAEAPPGEEAAAHPAAEAGAAGEEEAGEAGAGHAAADPEEAPEYVRMNNQFVIPVLEGGQVVSLVILSLSLEVQTGRSQEIYAREPKLRDAFLRVLFDHANAGGFRGAFTDGANLVVLRKALLEQARSVCGDQVHDVLISDIARQDA